MSKMIYNVALGVAVLTIAILLLPTGSARESVPTESPIVTAGELLCEEQLDVCIYNYETVVGHFVECAMWVSTHECPTECEPLDEVPKGALETGLAP